MTGLPSLNLSFEKHTSTATSLASTNSNDNSARNSVVLNIINPMSPPPIVAPNPRKNVKSVKKKEVSDDFEIEMEEEVSDEDDSDEPSVPQKKPKQKITKNERNVEEPPPAYKSPAFDEIEKEFKDQLLSFTTDLLLKDFDLLKNIAERGNKIIFHATQLKQVIAILYLSRDDRPKYDELIEIETEKVVMNNCFCKDCFNPFYLHIKNIFVSNKTNFLTTPYAVSMSSTFRINLDLCLTGE
jgi:hypothetical protein